MTNAENVTLLRLNKFLIFVRQSRQLNLHQGTQSTK